MSSNNNGTLATMRYFIQLADRGMDEIRPNLVFIWGTILLAVLIWKWHGFLWSIPVWLFFTYYPLFVGWMVTRKESANTVEDASKSKEKTCTDQE